MQQFNGTQNQGGAQYQTKDFALSLEGRSTVALVQRAGQTLLVVAQEGHSITSTRAVGSVEPTILPAGANPPYTVTELDWDIIEQIQRLKPPQGFQQGGGQHNR